VTADQLLQNVKDRAALPPAQVVVTDPKILNMATEEMLAFIAPLLENTNEEFFTDHQDIPLVAGQTAYDIPTRAMNSAVRALKWLDVNGIEGPPLNRIDLVDINRYASLSSPAPAGFYPTATQVVVAPAPGATSGSLRCYYSSRPGVLINGTSLATVSSATDTVLTCASVATGIFAVGQTVDIISPNSPFKLKAKDQIITASTATTITIGAGGLSAAGVSAGDYVTLSSTSYVPQIPLEWHSLLELRTVARVLAALGDARGQQGAMQDAAMIEMRVLNLAQPRFQNNNKKLNAWRK
jgi:hypothetical protein